MSLLETFVNYAGDFLGTSKLAKMNNRVFQPLVGTGLTRKEYEMGNGPEVCHVPDKNGTRYISSLKDYDRQSAGDNVLDSMVANGTVFSDRRIVTIANAQKAATGSLHLPYAVESQLSTSGSRAFTEAQQTERKMQALRMDFPHMY